MLLRTPEIAVPDSAPFENDKLGRKAAVDAVTSILQSTDGPFVISINAPWGYGKSTFLRMLRTNLRLTDFKTILFNAWESDYIEDPFVALLGDTEEQLKSLKSGKNQSLQNKINKVKKLGSKIIKAAIPVAAKIATSGLVNKASSIIARVVG